MVLLHPSTISTCQIRGQERIALYKAGQLKATWPVCRSGWRAARLTALRLDNREIYDAVLDLILVRGLTSVQVDAYIASGLRLRDGQSYDYLCPHIEAKIKERRTARGYAMALRPGGGGPVDSHKFQFIVRYGGY
jgi:hypothetical protein